MRTATLAITEYDNVGAMRTVAGSSKNKVMIFVRTASVKNPLGGICGAYKIQLKFRSSSKEEIRISIPKPGHAIMRPSDIMADLSRKRE